MEGLVAALTVFVLAIFVGFEVIQKVPPTLHTPLTSGSNAISGITIVGALVSAGTDNRVMTMLGFAALVAPALPAQQIDAPVRYEDDYLSADFHRGRRDAVLDALPARTRQRQ